MSEPEIGGLLALATAMLLDVLGDGLDRVRKTGRRWPVSFLRLIVACGLMAVYCRIACGRWLPTDAAEAIDAAGDAAGEFLKRGQGVGLDDRSRLRRPRAADARRRRPSPTR